jgi:catechol 2,3-dioxygenase-like lactoylglutathione lyase family enzyme
VRLAHLSLAVADQQRSRRFYQTFFGFDCDGNPDAEGCLHLTDVDDFDLTLAARP